MKRSILSVSEREHSSPSGPIATSPPPPPPAGAERTATHQRVRGAEAGAGASADVYAARDAVAGAGVGVHVASGSPPGMPLANKHAAAAVAARACRAGLSNNKLDAPAGLSLPGIVDAADGDAFLGQEEALDQLLLSCTDSPSGLVSLVQASSEQQPG